MNQLTEQPEKKKEAVKEEAVKEKCIVCKLIKPLFCLGLVAYEQGICYDCAQYMNDMAP